MFQQFQPWFIEFVAIASDILVGLSAIVVAILGIVGLRQWKAELKGKTKFDLARQLAKTAMQYRDEVKRARNPFTYPGESIERKKGEDESREETQTLDENFARRNRLVPLQKSLGILYELGWEAEVLLDEQVSEHITQLENVFRDLYAAIDAYFGMSIRNLSRRQPIGDEEWLQRQFQIIYGPADDEFSQALDDLVNDFTKKLKNYMK
jgi:hypothetical protein